MRLKRRALALTAVTALALGGTAAPAAADSPALSSADPAPDVSLDVDPDGVTLTFDQSLSASSTIAVSGPSGTCLQTSPLLVPSTELSCGFLPGDLPDGTYTVSYTAEPSSGSDPATTGSYDFFLDSVAPAAPTAVAIAPDPYDAASTTLTVTGTSEDEDDTVEVVVASGAADLSQDVDAGAGGAFTATFTAGEVAGLPDGTLTATARSTDVAGNEGPEGSDTALKDTTAPGTPTVLVGPDPVNAANQGSVTVSGTSDGTTVDVVLGDGPGGVADLTQDDVAVSGGSYAATFDATSLPDGTITATVVATDAAGNLGTEGTDTATKDTGVPGAPTVNTLPFANQANSSAFPVSGTGEPGASVAVTVTRASANVTKNATVAFDGTWSTTVDVTGLSDGTLTVTATQTDAAGNTSPVSGSRTTTKDTVSPGTPTVLISPDPVNNANRTAVTVSGSSDGATVRITWSDGAGGGAALAQTVTVSGAGTYSRTFNVSTLSDGTITATVVATDAAGNTGNAETDTATKDTGAPPEPEAEISPKPINIATMTAVTVSGTSTEASVRITVSDGPGGGDDLVQTVSVSGSSYTKNFDVSSLDEGTITASVVAIDLAGNTGQAGTDFAFKDAVAPTKSSSSPVEGSRVLPPTAVVLTFSESLATGSISIPGVAGTSSRSGSTVTFTPATTMPEGTLTATATVTDLRGNPGSGTVSFVVDDGFATTSTTLDPLPSAVSYQKAIKLSGQVTRPDKSVAALPVMVSMRDEAGRTSEIALVTPSASGAWSFLYRPTVNGTFSATYLGDAKNAASTSGDRTTKVRVGIAASTTTGPAARKATVRGSVTPAKVGAVVKLFRVGKGGTKLLGKAKVKAGGRFTFKVRLPKGRTKLQVSIGVTPGNLGGSARLTAFRT